jgi:hypothetical protein
MEKNRHGKRKLVNPAEFRAGSLERWDDQSDVLVLSFGVGFEGASSGSVGLVAFRFLFLISGGPVRGAGLWCRFSAR